MTQPYFPVMGLKDAQSGKEVQATYNRELRIAPTTKLCGKVFTGAALDTGFWTSTVVGSATNTISNGHAQLKTTSGGTTDSIKLNTVGIAIFSESANNVLTSISRFATAGTANNLRRLGALTLDNNNGYFFELNGTTFGIGHFNSGSKTTITTDFNGNISNTYSLDTNYHTFEIVYGARGADFYIDNQLLHSLLATTTPLVADLSLYGVLQNTNTGAVTGTPELDSASTFISRTGELYAQPKAYYIGSNGTYVLKTGAGLLYRVVLLDNAGTVTVYDNTAGSGTLLGSIDGTAGSGTLEFSATYNVGLTVVTGGGAKATIVYE